MVKGVHGVRYQVKDVARSVAFYTQQLGFALQHQQLPAFANVSLGGTQLLLSGPGAPGRWPDAGRARPRSARRLEPHSS
jgi:glyoxylase I family protein